MSEPTTYPQAIISNDLDLNSAQDLNSSLNLSTTESTDLDSGLKHAFPNPQVCDTAPLAYDHIHKTTGFIRKTSFNNGVLDLTTTERMLKGIKVVEHTLDIEQAFKLGEEQVAKQQQIPKPVYPLITHKFKAKTATLEVSELLPKFTQHLAEQEVLAAQTQIAELEPDVSTLTAQVEAQDQATLAQEQHNIAQAKPKSQHISNLNAATNSTQVNFVAQAEETIKQQAQEFLSPESQEQLLESEIIANDPVTTHLHATGFYDDKENEAQLAATTSQDNITTDSENSITDTVVQSSAPAIEEATANNDTLAQEPDLATALVSAPEQDQASEQPLTTADDKTTASLEDIAKQISANIESQAPVVVVDPANPNLSHSEIVNLIDTARQFNPVDIEHKLRAQQKLAQELDDVKHKKLVPYALIVFGNDGMCFEQCLESVRSYCKRGVLIYNETTPGMQDDGSIELAQEFVDNNPGFRLYRYPVPIIPQNFTPLMDKLLNGSVHRYWLIDCMYNYGLLHIHKLAEENGEKDNVVVFKVDANVIYNTSALEYAHTILETHSDQIDYMMFDQVNVVGDYRKAKVSGLKKIFSVFVSHKRPSIHKAWFRKIDHINSHFFCKLDKLSGFGTKFVIPAIDNHAEYDLSKPQVLAQFRYELETKFTNDVKGFSGISNDDVSTKVLVGFNFKEDHDYAIEGTDITYDQGQAYTDLPNDVKQTYKSIIDLDPEFWSKDHLLDLYSNFRLPASLEPALYLSDKTTNLEQLFSNKLYTMDSYLVGFNARLDALHQTDPDYGKFSSDKYVLMRLLNELTTGVDISYVDCKHLVDNASTPTNPK